MSVSESKTPTGEVSQKTQPVPMNPMAQFKPALDAAEAKKKEGDIHFAKREYEEAIKSYGIAAGILNPIRFLPAAENCGIRIFSNHIQSLIKLDQKDKALGMCEFARGIASVGNDLHLQKKIYSRRAALLEELGNHSAALKSIDHAISLDPSATDLDESRERLISVLSVTMFNPPPRPREVTQQMVTEGIQAILKKRGDPSCSDVIMSIVDLPGYIDKRDSKGNNLMWAVCQASIMRSATEGEDADDVLPLLQLLIENGSMAEQRYPSEEQQNKTPLMMLSIAGAVECARLLIKNRGNLVCCDDNGWTPLLVACSPKHPRRPKPDDPDSASNDAMVELLVQSGAGVNFRMMNGMSPLSLAAQGGDHHSINQLIIGGATLNLRCANGFSPIVWALIGSKGREDTETISTLVQAAKDLDKELLLEMEEDMKCFRLGRLIMALKQVLAGILKSHQEQSAAAQKEGEEGAPKPEPPKIPTHEIHLSLVMAMAQLSGAIPFDATTFVGINENFALKVYAWFINYIPQALFKEWTPVDNPQAAMAAASPLDKARLAIMISAATGPSKNDVLFSRDTNNNFMLCGKYPDYRLLMIEPLLTTFSSCVPTKPLLQLLQGHSPLVHVASRGSDYWVHQARVTGSDVSVVMRKVVLPDNVDPASVALPNVLTFIEDKDLPFLHEYDFSNDSNKTLFFMWNIPPADRMDILNKFNGDKIIIFLHVDTESDESNVLLKSKYTCSDTFVVATWLPNSTTVTVWQKKGEGN
jgi:tetratricopeptide (TPR) repeat protein